MKRLHSYFHLDLGLLPLLLGLGLPVSLSGPFANLLAVPWVGLLIVPLALLGTAGWEGHPGAGAPVIGPRAVAVSQ